VRPADMCPLLRPQRVAKLLGTQTASLCSATQQKQGVNDTGTFLAASPHFLSQCALEKFV
jgi:hypothetical protein